MTAVLALFFLAAGSPEQRAVDYLAREVERWPGENHCYSCHNNGDAARAVFAAARLGYTVPKTALAGTEAWLSHPENWDKPQAGAGFNNAKLARIQFAAALAESRAADRALKAAAESLLPMQDADGRWEIDTSGAAGAPATYGTALATYMARSALQAAGTGAVSVARADLWFERATPGNVLDAAALLLAMPKSEAVRAKCLPLIRAAQTSDGGWGPQPRAPAEVFDTAIVVLALHAAQEPDLVAKGRKYLLAQQQDFGGWQETTRPSGHESYAEHISTTAWALYSLLMTDSKGH